MSRLFLKNTKMLLCGLRILTVYSFILCETLWLCACSIPQETSNISYDEIMNSIKTQKQDKTSTDAQLESILKSYIGKRVSWNGWVFDVKEKGSNYEIWVDMDAPNSGFSVQDVYLETSKKEALDLSRKEEITFEGNIKNISSFLGKYTIALNNVKFY